jgi:integrase
MKSTPDSRNKMRGGVRRRGINGKWEYTIDLGIQSAQRCPACTAAKKAKKLKKPGHWWLARCPLRKCPNCGGELTDAVERRQQTQGGYATQKEAQKARTNAMHDLGQGTHIVRDGITLREYLEDEWLPSLSMSNLRATTLASYRSHVTHHLAPTKLGAIRLQQLNRQKIAAHYGWLLAHGRADGTKDKDGNLQPLTASTVRRIHATLHRALRDAVRSQLLPMNPANDIELPSAGGAERRLMAWDSAQLRKFLTSIRGDRLSALWLLYATTGARRGELLGLKWEDLDLKAGRLTIRRAHVEVGGEIIVSTPKTKSGYRTIELDAATVAALKHHATRQKEERLAAGTRWQGSGHVFVSEVGQPVWPGVVSRCFTALVKASSLPTISLHGLRHTFITVGLLELGLPTSMVSKRVGHANEGITLTMYAEWLPRHDQQAAVKVAALVVPKGF